MTLADEIAQDILAVRRDVRRIEALSRTRPHVFAEQKDDVERRLDKIAARVRNTFGGTPERMEAGRRTGPKGKAFRVERRLTAPRFSVR